MPELKTREYRAMQPMVIQTEQKKFDSDYYVEGYAAKFAPYVLWEDENGAIYEQFDRNCFASTDMSDVIMQYDHSGKVLARLRNHTLSIEIDDVGIKMAADLSKSEAARNMFEEISNGLVDRMSWGFIPGDYEYNPKTRTFTHYSIKKIFDVSAVSIPANENTNIQARSLLINGEIERALREAKESEEAKAKLLLKLKLGGF